MTNSLEEHKIVSENDWVEARKSLLIKEKEFTVLRDKAETSNGVNCRGRLLTKNIYLRGQMVKKH